MSAQAHDIPWERIVASDVLPAAERIFAEALRDFIAELCLVDAGVLIGWVRAEQHGNIADLVASSAELLFVEGTLAYADRADVSLAWGRSLQVVLDLEYVTRSATVFFQLVLHGAWAGVAVQRIFVEGGRPLSLEGFARAVAQGRRARP